MPRALMVMGQTDEDAKAVVDALMRMYNCPCQLWTDAKSLATVSYVDVPGTRVWIASPIGSLQKLSPLVSCFMNVLGQHELPQEWVLVGTQRDMSCDMTVAMTEPRALLASTKWHDLAVSMWSPQPCPQDTFLRYMYCRMFPDRAGNEEWLSAHGLPSGGPVLAGNVESYFGRDVACAAEHDGLVINNAEQDLVLCDVVVSQIESILARGDEFPAKPAIPGTHVAQIASTDCDRVTATFLQQTGRGFVVRARCAAPVYMEYARNAAAAYALEWLV